VRKTPDPEILSILIERGLAHPNPHGDGAWGWTKKGKDDLDSLTRGEISNMMWDRPNAMSDLFWPDIQKKFGLPCRVGKSE